MDEALACAVSQAQKSAETFRHGAVLLCGRSIVAAGRNRNHNACGLSSIHAEMDAAWRVKRRRPSHVVVVRLRRDTEFGFSRPCVACVRALARMGVSRMTYTTGDPRCPLATEPLACVTWCYLGSSEGATCSTRCARGWPPGTAPALRL